MSEQYNSPDWEYDSDFADAYRFNGNIIRHSQYVRGAENTVEQSNKYEIPELKPLKVK